MQNSIPPLIRVPSEKMGDNFIQYRLIPAVDHSQARFDPIPMRLIHASQRLSEWQNVAYSEKYLWSGNHPYLRGAWGDAEPTEIGGFQPDIDPEKLNNLRLLEFIASEFMNHIRTSLDQLAYNLSWHDNGKPPSHSSLPIRKSAESFGKEKRSALKGISSVHQEMIERIQPYNGFEWTDLLADINNRDKHRVSISVVEAYEFSVDRSKTFLDPLGTADHRGWEIENPKIVYLLGEKIGFLDGHPHVEVEHAMRVILLGAVIFINEIFDDIGISRIEYSGP